ncbi:2-dehydropantoate 2-reductase [Paenibacillus sophorae]|uniref:2-dehydropantoate 2-reductase n=1 Tax=Paenibacillus sophorae TaxID=1333845 RepID=A0A1H8R5A7_9BACL|nr:2-dehydropantoate 2-reductase [Paenibacillus sophorae]QWU14955.1 2-dehydropantoate 2-reductase [Paenibacillus sophorae]SEO61511.1 2-dehydropantoate 2-reductase [Paenibacillus sophorae]
MRIDIIGAGSLGLLLAGKLIFAGSRVRLWCRSEEQCAALSEDGITVSYEDGREPILVPGSEIEALPMSEFSRLYPEKPGDWLVLTVKQGPLHKMLPELLAPLRQSELNLLCLQNGWGHMELLRELLPAAHLYAAVTTEGAKRESQVRVVHAGTGQTVIGLWGESGTVQNNIAASLAKALVLAGFPVTLSNQVDTAIFRKLLINAVINPLTAVWRIPNGELLSSDLRLSMMRELYEEAVSVYDACGIACEFSLWDDILEVCRATSGNLSSMLADVLASRETEIGWINGSLVELAKQSGIDVPAHRWIIRMVEGMIVKER